MSGVSESPWSTSVNTITPKVIRMISERNGKGAEDEVAVGRAKAEGNLQEPRCPDQLRQTAM